MGISLDDPMFFQKVNAIAGDKLNQESMAKHIEEEKVRNTTSETLLIEQLKQVYRDGYYSNNNTDQDHFKAHLEWFKNEIQERVKEAKRQTMIRELGWASRNGIEGVRKRIAEITKEEGKV